MPLKDSTVYVEENSPQHITLCQIYSMREKYVSSLLKELSKIAGCLTPISAVTEEKVMFGPNYDTPVIKISIQSKLRDLHLQLVETVNKFNPTYDFPEYMGNGFQPHITLVNDLRIKGDIPININSFTLLDCGLNDDLFVKVIRTFSFQ
ncbi:MAG TPA: 2'-5' RNA ligase family protein [Candidatus Saccharimonadales bacterium]|nr:2'-5' RNA ligase family protein [Candidatus Saccharimonadales bacterium]